LLSRWPIRYKLLLGVGLLFLIVALLSFSGFRGVYSYRQLARSISRRAAELPLAADWTRSVDELRFSFSQLRSGRAFPNGARHEPADVLREQFRINLLAVKESLRRYRAQ
jgi:hypothetical protein